MELDIYQLKETWFIASRDKKIVHYTNSGEIFFGGHDDVFKELDKLQTSQPKINWIMFNGNFLKNEHPKKFMEYAKICEGTYNGEVVD